jgi:hypothetical protein
MPVTRRRREGGWWLPSIALLACLAASPASSQPANPRPTGWKIEQGVEIPSYAAVEPTTTNLNVDMVVLACEETRKRKILQFQLYLSDDGPLRPIAESPGELSDDPRASISIGAQEFSVALLFADDHAVLADRTEDRFPALSDRLIEALQTGPTMILHFDLGAKRPGRPASFDGEAIVDLQGIGARDAIRAMRRCAGRTNEALRSICGAGVGEETEQAERNLLGGRRLDEIH